MSFDGDNESDSKKRADALYRAIKRQGEALIAKGLIGRNDKHLWRTSKRLGGSTDIPPVSSGVSSGQPENPLQDQLDELPSFDEMASGSFR